jgi:hypothetical protein
MTRFTRIAIAALLSASSFAISQTSAGVVTSATNSDTKIVLPQEVKSFLQAVDQDSSSGSSCFSHCQATHTSCVSSASTNDAKSACEKALSACDNACPKNKN